MGKTDPDSRIPSAAQLIWIPEPFPAGFHLLIPTPLGHEICGPSRNSSPFPHATQARPVRQGIPRNPTLCF
ncbi:hypothetical protein NW816_12000 [Synechococcus sp. W55.1]